MFIGIGGRIIELSNLPGASRPGGTVIIPLSISYDQTAYCADASNPTPTVAGNEGAGTYSSTTGIVFADSGTNTGSSTGIINISSSTPGATYVITYTDTNAATATFDFTLNALDNASFAYSASSYDPADPDPTPTISGLAGGTFSSTTGLVFVDSGTNTGSSTGQIDLSATTIASYTITYDTTSSGSSVCPNTSTQSVEVALASIANNYSMSFDGTDEYVSAGRVLGAENTSTLSVSFWLKIPSIGAKSYLGYFIGNFGSGWLIEADASSIYFVVGDTGTGYQSFGLPYSGNIAINNWYNIVMVFDGTQTGSANILKAYINGTQKTLTGSPSFPSSIPTLDATAEFIIGGIKPSTVNGAKDIDEVGIWNTALTSTQVSGIYSATGTNLTKDLTTVSGSNLVYWNRMGD